MNLDKSLYSNIDGPYNRKNVFGAVFSYGPFFTNPKMITIRDEVLYSSFCGDLNHNILDEFGIYDKVKNVNIKVNVLTSNELDKVWHMNVIC